jgi:polygalacturonase
MRIQEMKKFISSFIAAIAFLSLSAQSYNILDFGAVADASSINTESIQKAIDKCFDNGGGMVYVPSGTFITGTIYLKSNVNLHLESGSTLKGSSNLNDYAPFERTGYGPSNYGVLFTLKAENVSITGQGTIDGNEEAFFVWDKAKKIEWGGTRFTRQGENYRKVESGIGDGPVEPLSRPRQMVIFSQCKNVLVENVKISKSPFWTLHFADCDGVIVKGVKIWNSLETPNSDGLDITSCSNVSVSDCDIRAGDDAIAITGYALHFELPGYYLLAHASENINITNCNLQSRSSGIRIGFLDQNTIRNINISNINITNSNRGIGIFLRDSGSIENVSISHVNIDTRLHTGDWWGNGEPIHISAIRGKDDVKLGKIKNVKFDHINCKGENGFLLYGTEESIIEDVAFRNITFELIDSKLNDVAGGNIDLRGCLGEDKQLFERDLPAFLAQYVNGLTIENFELVWTDTRMPYFTHGIEVTHFNGLRIYNFDGTASPLNYNAYPVFLQDGSRVDIDIKTGVLKKSVKK